MSIAVRICPDPQAAEDQLDRWIAGHRPSNSDGLQRLNILVGSGLQRRYHQRRLARNAASNGAPGAHAAIYFFTPTDLAREITARSTDPDSDPPVTMPSGAVLPLIESPCSTS